MAKRVASSVFVNKTKFLAGFGIRSGAMVKEANELIADWHIACNLPLMPNLVHKSLIAGLRVAIPYWRNLVEAQAEGFQNKNQRKTSHTLLQEVIEKNEPIDFFDVLCPSYKKGKGAVGFASVPGNTTKRAFANLARMAENTTRLGLSCTVRVFFADIAVESPNLLTNQDWKDFENIIREDRKLSKRWGMPFQTLTEFEPKLAEIVGREGKLVDTKTLPVSPGALERGMWRDRQFYPEMFGWAIERAETRTRVHAHSYYWQGVFFREKIRNPVMVYSAYDYEKGALYNGPDYSYRPCIVYPKKVEGNPETATISLWEA